MTILRRVGSMTLIPGTPTIPAVPGYYRKKVVPDPPSQMELTFQTAFWWVGVPLSTVFKGGTIIVTEAAPPGGPSRPPEPGTQEVDYYNGQKGKFVIITYPDGRKIVVRQ